MVTAVRSRWTVVAASIIAAAASVVGWPHMQELTMRAGGWLSWLEMVATEGLVAASALVLLTGRARSWSAWLTVVVSVPINLVAIPATAQPWLAWLVALWPLLAVAFGYTTFVAGARKSANHQEEHR
jgi:hypothetical protein